MSTSFTLNFQFPEFSDTKLEEWPAGSWPGKPHRRTEEEELRELIDDLIDSLEIGGEGEG